MNECGAGDEGPRLVHRMLERTRHASWPANYLSLTYAAWAAAAVCAFIASLAVAPGPSGLLGGALAAVMLAIAATDARQFRIPDVLVVAALVLGVAEAALSGRGQSLINVARAALQAAVLAALFLGFRIGYRRIRGREGLGLGDVKLAAVAGLWLSWMMAAIAIDIAALSALAAVVVSLARKQKVSGITKVPFGLFFAPAIWLGWLLGATVLR